MYKECVLIITFFSLKKCTVFADLALEYEKIINNGIAAAASYQLDKNAYRYKPYTDQKPMNCGTYDFIIIGASPAGCVLANRLSEITKWNILVIEAGNDTNKLLEIPGTSILGLSSDYSWGISTVPQKNACLGYAEGRCGYGRGRGLGGSSVMNGMVACRGSQSDFNEWYNMGNEGWSFKDVLPYFLKLQDFHKTNPSAPVNWMYHKMGGYQRIEFGSINNSRTEAFVNAHLELGYNLIDYNSNKQIGVSPIQFTAKHGHRVDAGTAYIKPIQSRKNFDIMLNSYATRININKSTNRATDVYFTKNGKTCFATAKMEVISSAGAFQSPQLLMLSGIGPREHLEKNNIEVIQELEVGSFFKDQINFNLFCSHNSTDDISLSIREDIEKYLQNKGDLTSQAQLSILSFYQSKLETLSKSPDIEYLMSPRMNPTYINLTSSYKPKVSEDINISLGSNNYFVLNVIILHTKSTGTVRLRNNNPYEYPYVDPNLMELSQDLDVTYESVLQVQRLLQTKALKKINANLILLRIRGCEPFDNSKTYWICVLKQIVMPAYHPTSTCPMGPNPSKEAVVNKNLIVHGIKNLRIADASVIPLTMSNHPTIPCIMIGEKASDLIKAKYNMLW